MRKIFNRIENAKITNENYLMGPTTLSDYIGKTYSFRNCSIIIENIIAEGGFSVVFLAKNENSFNKSGSLKYFALKRMLVNNQDDLNVCKREIDILKSIEGHQHLVSMIDFKINKILDDKSDSIEDDPIHEILILMDYYKDNLLQQLNDHLKLGGAGFEEELVLTIFQDICLAVCHLHSNRPWPIIHRDLKIENILRNGQSGSFILCDFGSCIYDKSGVLDENQSITALEENIKKYTTLAYRSPEMVDLYSGLPITTKADIWALGCLLYKLCFLTTPFGENTLAIHDGSFSIPKTSKYTAHLHALIKYILTPDPYLRPDINEILGLTNYLLLLLNNDNSSQAQDKGENNINFFDSVLRHPTLDKWAQKFESLLSGNSANDKSDAMKPVQTDNTTLKIATTNLEKESSMITNPLAQLNSSVDNVSSIKGPIDVNSGYTTSIKPRERPKAIHPIPIIPAFKLPRQIGKISLSTQPYTRDQKYQNPNKSDKIINNQKHPLNVEDNRHAPHVEIRTNVCVDKNFIVDEETGFEDAFNLPPIEQITDAPYDEKPESNVGLNAPHEKNKENLQQENFENKQLHWNPFEKGAENQTNNDSLSNGSSHSDDCSKKFGQNFVGEYDTNSEDHPFPLNKSQLAPPKHPPPSYKGSLSSISNVKSRESLIMSISSSASSIGRLSSNNNQPHHNLYYHEGEETGLLMPNGENHSLYSHSSSNKSRSAVSLNNLPISNISDNPPPYAPPPLPSHTTSGIDTRTQQLNGGPLQQVATNVEDEDEGENPFDNIPFELLPPPPPRKNEVLGSPSLITPVNNADANRKSHFNMPDPSFATEIFAEIEHRNIAENIEKVVPHPNKVQNTNVHSYNYQKTASAFKTMDLQQITREISKLNAIDHDKVIDKSDIEPGSIAENQPRRHNKTASGRGLSYSRSFLSHIPLSHKVIQPSTNQTLNNNNYNNNRSNNKNKSPNSVFQTALAARKPPSTHTNVACNVDLNSAKELLLRDILQPATAVSQSIKDDSGFAFFDAQQAKYLGAYKTHNPINNLNRTGQKYHPEETHTARRPFISEDLQKSPVGSFEYYDEPDTIDFRMVSNIEPDKNDINSNRDKIASSYHKFKDEIEPAQIDKLNKAPKNKHKQYNTNEPISSSTSKLTSVFSRRTSSKNRVSKKGTYLDASDSHKTAITGHIAAKTKSDSYRFLHLGSTSTKNDDSDNNNLTGSFVVNQPSSMGEGSSKFVSGGTHCYYSNGLSRSLDNTLDVEGRSREYYGLNVAQTNPSVQNKPYFESIQANNNSVKYKEVLNVGTVENTKNTDYNNTFEDKSFLAADGDDDDRLLGNIDSFQSSNNKSKDHTIVASSLTNRFLHRRLQPSPVTTTTSFLFGSITSRQKASTLRTSVVPSLFEDPEQNWKTPPKINEIGSKSSYTLQRFSTSKDMASPSLISSAPSKFSSLKNNSKYTDFSHNSSTSNTTITPSSFSNVLFDEEPNSNPLFDSSVLPNVEKISAAHKTDDSCDQNALHGRKGHKNITLSHTKQEKEEKDIVPALHKKTKSVTSHFMKLSQHSSQYKEPLSPKQSSAEPALLSSPAAAINYGFIDR